MNKSFSSTGGYIGLLALLIVCAVAIYMMAQRYTPGTDGQSAAERDTEAIQNAENVKQLIEQKNRATMENL